MMRKTVDIRLVRFWLDNLWRWSVGLPEISYKMTKRKSITDLKRIFWSTTFEKYMRNRLVMGHLRYGEEKDSLKINSKDYDYIEKAMECIRLYEKTGNDELLVDIANYALLEFEAGKHPKKHFRALDRQ